MKVLFLLTVSILLSGCCLIDYTEDIQGLTTPLQAKFSEFVITNKRAPNLTEKENLLNDAGCTKISRIFNSTYEFFCTFNKQKFTVELDNYFIGVDESNKPESHGYFIKIKYKGSACGASLYSNGKPEKARCYKRGCIRWSA